MSENPVVKKLGIKPGQRVLVLNAPKGFTEGLAALPPDTTLSQTAEGKFECVLLFITTSAEFEPFAETATQAVKLAGLLWVAYPKLSAKVKSDLKRETVWPLLQSRGWGPVSQIAIDDVWSALRFRPETDIKRKSTSLFNPTET